MIKPEPMEEVLYTHSQQDICVIQIDVKEFVVQGFNGNHTYLSCPSLNDAIAVADAVSDALDFGQQIGRESIKQQLRYLKNQFESLM